MHRIRWWQECVFYQIYLPSFCDGNADGLGDFPGLEQKIAYLHALGITGIWITPFYPSPGVDNGYDISDYCAVDERFGTLNDVSRVIDACHARGIRVVIDLVVNHVSSQHPWFVDAWNNPASRYRDYFLFTDAPNNWQSFFSGSAWTPEPDTGQFYYHKFAPQQVDLNWANPQVEQEIYRVVDFWRARGVDGFRFDVINFLSTNGIGPDNPQAQGEQVHLHDVNQPGLLPVLRRLMRYIRRQGDVFLIGEIGSEDLAVLSRYQGPKLMDVVFNFNLGSQKTFDVTQIFSALTAMQEKQPGLPTLFFSSHDMPRMIGRFGDTARDVDRARCMMVLQLTARGVPFIYQGEEMGMSNYCPKTVDEIFDVQGKTHYHTALASGLDEAAALEKALAQSRDGSRSPMQWSAGAHAGFSTVAPWMPLNPDAAEIHADGEREREDSLWRDYQRMIALRGESEALRRGEYLTLRQTESCIWYSRATENEQVWVAINFGDAVTNPLRTIMAETVAGSDTDTLTKNQFVIKRSCYETAQ
nr:alpha-glucosidase [uncultured Enterobacter sp.]